MTQSSHLGNSMLWSIANATGSLSIKLGTLAILSRLLDPGEFGAYSMGMAVVLILSVIGQFGIPTKLITATETNGLTEFGLALGLLGGFLVSALAAATIFSFSPATFYAHRYALLGFALLVILQIATNILEAIERRDLNFRLLATTEMAASIFGSGLVSITCAMLGLSTAALILGQIVYCIIKSLALMRSRQLSLTATWSFSRLSILTSDSWSVLLAEGANMATVQIQRPIVGMQIGVDAAGLWARVYQVVLMQLAVIVQPLDNLIVPVLARLREKAELRKAGVIATIQVVGLLTLPVASATTLLAPILVPILFGGAWLELVLPLQIGSSILFFRGIERVMLSVSRATGAMTARAKIQIIQLIIVVASLYFSAPFGMLAASWAYLGALTVGFCITLSSIRTTAGISAFQILKALAPGFLIAVAPLGAATLMADFNDTDLSSTRPLLTAAALFIMSLAILWRSRARLLSPLVSSALSQLSNRLAGRTKALR